MSAKQSLEEQVPGGLAGEGVSEHCGQAASAEDAPSGSPLQAVAVPTLSREVLDVWLYLAVVISQLFLP